MADRRQENKSSSGETADSSIQVGLSTQDISIEQYVATKDPYRISSNGVPLTLPFRNIRGDAAYRAAKQQYEAQGVEDKVLGLLERYNLSCRSINVTRRYKQYGDEDIEIDTLGIDTDSRDPSKWMPVAVQIKDFVQAHSQFKSIDVEICNSDFSQPKKSSILSHDPDTLRNLNALEPLILQELDSSEGLQWRSLAFHNRSLKGDLSELAKKPTPTVLVYVKPWSRFNYGRLESRLKRLLDTSDIPIGLEILPGVVVSGS